MIELIVSLLLAALAGFALACSPKPLFFAGVLVSTAFFIPAIGVSILCRPVAASLALALAILPLVAWGWRRTAQPQWRTARQLGGSWQLIARVLILPALAPFLVAALLLGAAAVATRWQLDKPPVRLLLPEPPTATG